MSRIFALVLVLITLPSSYAKEVFIASVSPEFTEGLHARYFNYLSDKLGVAIKIKPMPLARRIKELEKGSIDLIILTHRDADELVFLPSYIRLRQQLFVRYHDKDRFNDYNSLSGVAIANSIDSKISKQYDDNIDINKVTVSALKQKILLLDRQRIDGFFHTRPSANKKIDEMNLSDRIVESTWQPAKELKPLHFVTSKQSSLLKYRAQLSQVIIDGKNNGDFDKIRENYYQ